MKTGYDYYADENRPSFQKDNQYSPEQVEKMLAKQWKYMHPFHKQNWEEYAQKENAFAQIAQPPPQQQALKEDK
jgi:hypothetical protein